MWLAEVGRAGLSASVDPLAVVRNAVAAIGEHGVAPAPALHAVAPAPADPDPVGAGASHDLVPPWPGLDHVTALAALQAVAPLPPREAVAGTPPGDPVAAAAAPDPVRASRPDQPVGARCPVDRVAAYGSGTRAAAAAEVHDQGPPDVALLVDGADRDVALRRPGDVVGLPGPRGGGRGSASERRGARKARFVDRLAGGSDLV